MVRYYQRGETLIAMSTDPLQVIFFGTSSAFSAPPLQALLEAGLAVRAVVMPALNTVYAGAPPIARRAAIAPSRTPGRALPLLTPLAERSVASIAAERGIPLFEVARLADPETIATLAAYEPDAICVACFPLQLPSAILELPRLGCLNVHPSLLPDNRGPDPLFWTFRRGDAETGVTIHRMDMRLDSGPMLAQASILVPDGIAEADLEGQLALLGGWLLTQALSELSGGTAHPVPQDEARATYYPLPGPDDYTITSDRSARWAHNFARGLMGRSEPLRILTGDAVFRVIASLGYDEGATRDAPWRLEGDVLSLRCAPGVFRARVAHEPAEAASFNAEAAENEREDAET